MTTLTMDLESAPMGWESDADELRAGRPPEAAIAWAAHDAEQGEAPENYGTEAAARWREKKRAKVISRAWKWYRDRAFDSKLGQVVCIGVGVGLEEPVVLWEPTERGTLVKMEGLLTRVNPRHVVAWNGFRFDFPMMAERALLYGLTGLARWFVQVPYGDRQALGIPHPPTRLVDPSRWWPKTRESSGKLVEIAGAMGLRVDDPIDGSRVLDSLVAGRPEDVRTHVTCDIHRLRHVLEPLAVSVGLSL